MRLSFNTIVTFSIAIAGFLACGVPANANLLTNGSFESGQFTDNGFGAMSLNAGATNITGWSIVTQELAWETIPNTYSITPTDGNFFLDLTGYHDYSPFSGVQQTIATTINATYLLTFDIGNSNLYNNSSGSSIYASAGNNTVIFGNNTNAINSWLTASMLFQATSSNTVVTLQGWGGQNYVGLDNVSVTLLTPAVPEPSSIALAGLGAIGFAFGAHRRRHTTAA